MLAFDFYEELFGVHGNYHILGMFLWTLIWYTTYTLSPIFMSICFPTYWNRYLSNVKKGQEKHHLKTFQVNFVAFSHAVYITYGAMRYFWNQSFDIIPCEPTKVEPLTQYYLTVAAGYFLFDTLVVLLIEFTWAFFMHGFFALVLYSIAIFVPFLQYFALFFMLCEASTPFLHLRWFALKIKASDTFFFRFNQYTFGILFFIGRIIIAYPMNYKMWICSLSATEIYPLFRYLYVICPFSLCVLNGYWLILLLKSMSKKRSKKK